MRVSLPKGSLSQDGRQDDAASEEAANAAARADAAAAAAEEEMNRLVDEAEAQTMRLEAALWLARALASRGALHLGAQPPALCPAAAELPSLGAAE